jgi:hypothetical protein
MTEAGGVVMEHEQHITSATKTSTIMKFSKQNGANSNGITDHILSNGISCVNSNQLNGLGPTATPILYTGSGEPDVWQSRVQKPISAETEGFHNGKCHN